MAPPAFLLLFIYHPLLRGEVLAARDLFRLFIPAGAFIQECLQRFEVPLWIPYQRLGQPFLATIQTRVLSPPAIVPLLIFGPVRAPSVEIALLAGLCAWGAARAARAIGCGRYGALISGCAFGLGPMLTQLSDQLHTFAALAWSGFIAEAAIRLARESTTRRAATLALFVALSFVAGSPETTLWQCGLALVLMFGSAPAGRKSPAMARAAAALVWGAALAAAVLLPAAEFAANSTRTADVAGQLQWAAPPEMFLAAGWLHADQPRASYWAAGEQGLIPSAFLGSTVMALALAGAVRRRSRPLVVFAIFSALLSLGEHFPPSAMVLQLPPFSFFRYPVKYFPGFAFAACLLCGIGVSTLAAAVRRRPLSRGWVLPALAVAASLGAAADPLTRALGMREGATLGLVWTVAFLAAGASAFILGRASTSQPRLGLAAIVLAELVASQAFLSQIVWADAAKLAAPSPYAAELRRAGGRISAQAEIDHLSRPSTADLEKTRPSLVPLRFVEERLHAVEGYSALEPLRINEGVGDASPAVLQALGVRWIVAFEPPYPGAVPAAASPGLPNLYELPRPLPRTFIVHQARTGSDADAVRLIRDPAAPARFTAIIASGEGVDASPAPGCRDEASIVRERSGALKIAASSCAPGYLVLMDAFYPGWKAAVDGVPATIVRANFVGRAVAIPAGEHTIEFTYRPLSFNIGSMVSLLALAIAIAVVVRARLGGNANLLSSADHGD